MGFPASGGRAVLVAAACLWVSCAAAGTKLLRFPDVWRDRIVFSYAGDLWTVPREGGRASRLTTGVGIETAPVFSPDGATMS